jgi:quercetin dioxygenase-like cupin family protein
VSRFRRRVLLAAGSFSLLLSGLAIADTATATTEPAPPPEASESSAAPGGPISVVELAPGVTAEVFAAVPSDRAPDQTVYLARFVFEPGSEIFPHNHPGTAVLAIESGTWGWTLLEGTAHVVRGAATGNTAVEDVTEPGTEVMLEVGDAIYYEDDVVHTARGVGDGDTVLWATGVFTPGEPLLMPADMEMAPATSAP